MDTPCIGVCTLTKDGSQCTGCTRTVSEIASWTSYTDEQRKAIMDRCLESVWGTKCKDCLTHSKRKQEKSLQDIIDNTERGLF